MALTDIARQLKETFDGFGVSEHQADVERFRKIYGDAECIHIGEMDYIVINQAYDTEENADVPENVSPLFFSSLNQKYAIIDAQTSSTLIDEVYSRITYMQRVCNIDALPQENEIQQSLSNIIGDGVTMNNVIIRRDSEDGATHRANIFQCQLIKDTGVSASPDVYSFMLKNGEIKEVSERVVRQIRHMGEVNILEEREDLEQNNAAIQQAVYDKYIKADMDIQSITVKSIFEITMPFVNILLFVRDGLKHNGVFRTVYLASENNEFDILNTSIQACNICENDLTDIKDPTKLNKLHINMDAYDEISETSGGVKQANLTYAVGCEDCLEQCPDCGGWHFNYKKFIGSRIYEKVNLVPGRSFIRGLRDVDVNYCACREGTEWIYDEESGTETEHDVIKMENVAFLNCADEMIASYEDYAKFREKEEKAISDKSKINTREFAMKTLAKFKKNLANKFEIDSKEIKISSLENCCRCTICGGKYYKGNTGDEYDYRCGVCDEMLTEKRHMIVRVDGMIFMYRKVNKKYIVNKYIMTKLGNLKQVSTNAETSPQPSEVQDVTTVTEVLDEE
jgi:serine/threonine-protein kinase RIO1